MLHLLKPKKMMNWRATSGGIGGGGGASAIGAGAGSAPKA